MRTKSSNFFLLPNYLFYRGKWHFLPLKRQITENWQAIGQELCAAHILTHNESSLKYFLLLLKVLFSLWRLCVMQRDFFGKEKLVCSNGNQRYCVTTRKRGYEIPKIQLCLDGYFNGHKYSSGQLFLIFETVARVRLASSRLLHTNAISINNPIKTSIWEASNQELPFKSTLP